MTTPSKAAFRAELESVGSALAGMAHAVVAAEANDAAARGVASAAGELARAGSGRRRQRAPRRRR